MSDDEKEKIKLREDMYGFLRDEKYILKEKNERQKNNKNISKRDQAWVKFLQKNPIEKILQKKDDKQLKKLIYQGIPVAFRGPIWSILSGAKDIEANSQKTYKDYCEEGKLIAQGSTLTP